jgi:hypothetical protein
MGGIPLVGDVAMISESLVKTNRVSGNSKPNSHSCTVADLRYTSSSSCSPRTTDSASTSAGQTLLFCSCHCSSGSGRDAVVGQTLAVECAQCLGGVDNNKGGVPANADRTHPDAQTTPCAISTAQWPPLYSEPRKPCRSTQAKQDVGYERVKGKQTMNNNNNNESNNNNNNNNEREQQETRPRSKKGGNPNIRQCEFRGKPRPIEFPLFYSLIFAILLLILRHQPTNPTHPSQATVHSIIHSIATSLALQLCSWLATVRC